MNRKSIILFIRTKTHKIIILFKKIQMYKELLLIQLPYNNYFKE